MAIPFIHQTDLFHFHGDPDDHWDLACAYALARRGDIDLLGIVIDYPPERRDGDPALNAVGQMAAITGLQAVPVLIGSSRPMRLRDEVRNDSGSPDAAAVDWILGTLRESAGGVVVNIVGSCTDVALAGKREPDLFRAKCRAVYLNAGAAFQAPGGALEYNVQLNPASYAAIFDLPCPVYWCPCWHAMDQRDRATKHGTFYSFLQRDILPCLSKPLQNYFLYMLSKSTDQKWLRYLQREPDASLLADFGGKTRKMWSTAAMLHAAGLMVEKDGKVVSLKDARNPLFSFRQISLACDDSGRPDWSFGPASPDRSIFQSNDPAAYAAAMTKALAHVLAAI